jgi:hypothetical protein
MRTTTPEDAVVVDTSTKPGELSPDASSSADPTTRRRWTATPAAIIRGARGEHLGPPQPHRRSTTRESRHLAHLAGEPTPTGRNQIFRGDVEGRKQPTTAVNQRRHRAARRRTSAALRLRDRFIHEHEVGRGRQPPQATTNLHRAQHQATKPFPGA